MRILYCQLPPLSLIARSAQRPSESVQASRSPPVSAGGRTASTSTSLCAPASPRAKEPKTTRLAGETISTASDRRPACKVGLPQLRLPDLRHTGNTLAAATEASTKELMSRMGHASPQAALIYQHVTSDRDRAIADALSDMATGAPILSIRQKRDLTQPPLGHVLVTPASERPAERLPQAPDQDLHEGAVALAISA